VLYPMLPLLLHLILQDISRILLAVARRCIS
jgi:hypothetical protein